ncbi:hypothetical protein KLP40_14515 [Hymenobacter sp. NST-14]|uniref:hypothetical protein n=1 Tax=Hymenobacter piscis TaxID=2839984 RepID=UPI001C034793|nr:hypothetical protein [Hymenobacter piscis]MBT9394381.1 hypothetical protein [Hymenobacter piscis]
MARRVKTPDIYAMTVEELEAHVRQLGERLAEHDARPENRQVGFHLLTPAARKRSAAMGWEIYHATRQLRTLRGETINDAGYTGRNSNRR